MRLETYFPKLIRAALESDRRSIESISLSILRKLKKEYPDISNEIAQILSYAGVGANVYRTVGSPVPKDNDSRLDLVQLREPILIEEPIFNQSVRIVIDNFLLEREKSDKLLADGIEPSKSMLVTGDPGVGKTYLAKYLAYKLNLNLVVLDLAASISSYLGTTGKNIKMILDYARSQPLILFLDEFDAISKRRDDASDLGELKRIVNVLLKELEEWPPYSIVIAATNHPELLDKAIWRRFDIVLNIQKPDLKERIDILHRYSEGVFPNAKFLQLIAELMSEATPAELQKLMERVRRKSILTTENPMNIAVDEMINFIDLDLRENAVKFTKLANNLLDLSYRKIASLIGKSASTVHNYLKE